MLTLLSGILYAKFGGAAFLPMALLCAVALPLAWLGFADERDRSVDFFNLPARSCPFGPQAPSLVQ